MKNIEINKNWNSQQPYTNVIIGKAIDTTPKYIVVKDNIDRNCRCSNSKCNCC
jgi:hypothetical protein